MTTQGRYAAAEAFAEFVSRIPRLTAMYESSRRTREWMVMDRVAKQLEIPEGKLRERIAESRQKQRKGRAAPSPDVPELALDPVERELLETLLQEPSYVREAAEQVPVELLRASPLRDVFEKCVQLVQQEIRPTYARLMAEFEDAEHKRLLVDLEANARHKGNVHQRLEAVLERFRDLKQQRLGKKLQEQLRPGAPVAEENKLLQQVHASKRMEQKLV